MLVFESVGVVVNTNRSENNVHVDPLSQVFPRHPSNIRGDTSECGVGLLMQQRLILASL